MTNPTRLSPRTLRTHLRHARKARAQKEAVIARHAPGTPWRTRAEREAATYRARVAAIEAELARREKGR